MIRRVSSDLPAFKAIEFKPGMNIVLAERTAESTEKQSRNAVGKTSAIEIVHFLLGSSMDSSALNHPRLRQAKFAVELQLNNRWQRASRSPSKPNSITVEDMATNHITQMTNTEWKSALGEAMFRLSSTVDDAPNAPSFRSLISYFVRRQSAGGFESPFKHSSKQQLVDQQVNVSYLLGLDWRIPMSWQRVRDEERTLRELRKAVAKGALGSVLGRSAVLRTEVALVEQRVEKAKERLKTFRIHDQYREIETEANSIARRISEVANEIYASQMIESELNDALKSEVPPSLDAVREVYAEINEKLADVVVRSLKRVQQFHKSIVRNRAMYLDQELESLRANNKQLQHEQEELGSRQKVLLEILETHGALDQYTALQSEVARLEAGLETLRQKYQAAVQLESAKTELEVARAGLQQQLSRRYFDLEAAIRNAIRTFQSFSSELYDEAGNLTIDVTSNGPVFSVAVQGERSKGISNMQVLCFDLTISSLATDRHIGPRFLVHDSHVFDGVDERQVRTALLMGQRAADEHGFQYIVTMNSDVFPDDLDEWVNPIRLTDATDDGGLFGFRF